MQDTFCVPDNLPFTYNLMKRHTGSSEYLNYTFPELPVSMTHFIE